MGRQADEVRARTSYNVSMRLSVMLVCLLGLLSASVAATTVPPMTEAALGEAADVVVEGTVAHSESVWRGTRIITFVTVVSGEAPALTTTLVALPGGVVDGIAQVVPGTPVLNVGARYRLYLGAASGPKLNDNGARARGVVGFFRGAFLLVDGEAGPVAVPLDARGRARVIAKAVTP